MIPGKFGQYFIDLALSSKKQMRLLDREWPKTREWIPDFLPDINSDILRRF
jgi:hypothetical protein